MFTIMENRKRPRLELINTNNNNSNETMQGVASTTTSMGTATLATIGGQSFILSNSSSAALPANILLSICDDNSDESEDYILDHSLLTQIKQEHTVATQTNNNNQTQQQPTLVAAMPQFRIVNQAGKPLNTSTLNSPNLVNRAPVNTTNSNSLISNSVHLPPGCEIYVIKEVIDNPKQVIAETNTTTTSPKIVASNQTTFKLEPMSPLPLLRNNTQNLNSNSTITLNTTSPVTTSSSSSNISSSTSPDDTAKRSLILEAYKKRDDKRRATHNEVERRRRDKINSWIFKLKEMLPSDVTPSSTGSNNNSLMNNDGLTSSAINQNSATARLLVQQQVAATTRTAPSDSKSQILIKACEYIKSMQEEINSLRECLTENENLRLSNQRLQDEINNLRNKQQQQQQKLHHNNNNILITTNTTNNNTNNNNNHNNDHTDDCELTLNSLNATYANVQLFAPSSTNQNNNNHHHHHLAGLVGLTTNSNNTTASANLVNVTYAKRELIITDYVD